MLVALVAEFLRVLNALKEVEQVSNLHQDIKGKPKGCPQREREETVFSSPSITQSSRKGNVLLRGARQIQNMLVCVLSIAGGYPDESEEKQS